MITQQDIQAVCQQIVDNFEPDQIILFGSYAYGSPTPDSDLDLLVLLSFEGSSFVQTVKIRTAIQCDFPLNLLVKNSTDAQKLYQEWDPFIRAAFDQGKVLYERNRRQVA